MDKFLNETMVATAREIYVDDVDKINSLIYEILQIIGLYVIAQKSFSNRFVVFLLNWILRILKKGY